MKLINRIFLLIFSINFLFGCVSAPKSIKATDRVDSQKGVLLASVTIDDARAVLDGSFFYSAKNSKKNKLGKGEYLIKSGMSMTRRFDDYPTDKSKNGRLIAIPMNAGDYELTNWNLFVSQAGGFGNISPQEPPTPLPFTIEAGHVTYLGNLHITTITGKNVFGIEVPFGAYPVITNNEQIDLSLLRSKYPNLNSWPIHSALIDGSQWQINK